MPKEKVKVKRSTGRKASQKVENIAHDLGKITNTTVHIMTEKVFATRKTKLTGQEFKLDVSRQFVKTTVPIIKTEMAFAIAELVKEARCEWLIVRSGSSLTIMLKDIE